jgi:hypothetical protein
VSTEQGPGPGQGPTEEQIRALEEQMRRLTVPDVVLETVAVLINLGGYKLAEERDLEQTKQAIEAARALLPLLPEDTPPQLRDALSQLQMAFVRTTQGGEQEEAPEEVPEEVPQEAPQEAGDAAEREKARSKIWTPPGA